METTRKTIAVRKPKWDISSAERLAIWRHARSVFSKRKTGSLLKEYKKIRRSWD